MGLLDKKLREKEARKRAKQKTPPAKGRTLTGSVRRLHDKLSFEDKRKAGMALHLESDPHAPGVFQRVVRETAKKAGIYKKHLADEARVSSGRARADAERKKRKK